MMCERRSGYLTIDALTALTIGGIAIAAAVGLASVAVARISQARDRLAAAVVASSLYEDLYAGERPDGRQAGIMSGRSWSYAIGSAGVPDRPSSARTGTITVDRKLRPDLVVEVVLPPAPDTRSSNSSSP